MRKKMFFLSSLLLLAVPAAALAAEGTVKTFELLPESVESVLELINLFLAVLAAAFAIKLAALAQGGDLEKTWNWIAVAVTAFAAIEIFAALDLFGLVHIGGLADILELIMVVIFVYILNVTRKRLLKRMLGK